MTFSFLTTGFNLVESVDAATVQSIQQIEQKEVEEISQYISQKMKQFDVMGLAVGLVDENSLVWSKGFGYQDKEKCKPATDNTVFRVGSLTKLFTATAIMQLASKGDIDIDYPIADYLPGFVIQSRFQNVTPITARHIMTHHSGLPSDLIAGWHNPSRDSVVGNLQNEYLATVPGSIYSYSNLATGLLGDVIEEISGKSFDEQMKIQLLQPLEMWQSSFVKNSVTAPLLSQEFNKGKVIDSFEIRDAAAGALYSSVSDMGNFMQMILAGGVFKDTTILGKERVQEMLSVQNNNVALDFGRKIGLGFHLNGLDEELSCNRNVIWHDGGIGNFHSLLVLLPEEKRGVVVLANSSGAEVIIKDIAKKVLFLGNGEESGDPCPPEIAHKHIAAKRELTGQEISQLPGFYGGSLVGPFSIIRKKHHLVVKLDGMHFELIGRGENSFTLQRKLFGILPVPDPLNSLVFYYDMIAGEKIITIKQQDVRMPIALEYHCPDLNLHWKKRLGEFEIVVEDNVETFALEDDRGLLKIRSISGDHSDWVFWFQPVSQTEAVSIGIGRGSGMILRAEDDALRTTFYFSGFTGIKTGD